jgi:heme/copper-type cytochrome/quinol oxidase subunit 4
MLKDNKIISGLIPAIVIPFILYIFFTWLEAYLSRTYGVKKILRNDTIYVLAVVISNFLLFQLYTFKFYLERASKGILLATFIYAFAYIILFQVLGYKKLIYF